MYQVESKWRFWIASFAVFALVVWALRGVLMPFLFGMMIAYFLNPMVDKLSRHKVPRWLSALGVLVCFGLIVALLLTLIIPLLQGQIGALVNAAPGYIEKFRDHYIPRVEGLLANFAPGDVEKLRDAASQSVGDATGWVGDLLKKIVTTSFAVIDILALTIITPVVAFYMMSDWPRVTAAIDSLFPMRYYNVIHEQLREIDNTLSGFIRGQAIICLVLGCYYSLGLTLVGLKYGAAVGVTAGVLTFIPYIGTGFGWVSSMILASVQFEGDATHILAVMGVFFVGHLMEGYVLTPRLVGHRVNLHPVWIMFALIAGAKLMGFTGVLLSVPVAAVMGVLIRFAVRQYRASSVYNDIV